MAQFNLGGMYNYGKGVPKDAVQAVFWYRKSAEQGNSMGQVRIPMMPISQSDLMPISSEASNAGLSQCELVIGIRQGFLRVGAA